MRRPIERLLACLALCLLGGPVALFAQTTTLDEGSFRLYIAGRPIGTENFAIRQSGTGDDAIIIAQGSIAVDTAGAPQEVRTILRVEGASLRPSDYDVTVRGAADQRIVGRVIGGRFSARIVSPAGEQMREYLASEGAVLVDAGVVHHHYFLARRAEAGARRMPIIIPRLNRQVTGTVEEAGRESVQVGGRTVQARRFAIALAGGPEIQLWVDDRGRVLRLEVPQRGFEAVRTGAPR